MVEQNIALSNLNNTLEWGCSTLEKIGIPYVLSGGTLLGLYRNKTLLEYDTDVDICVLEEDVGDVKEFRKKLMEATDIYEEDRIVFRDNYFTVYYEFELNPKKIPFDIFIMFKKGNKRYEHFFNEGENPNTEKCLIWPEKFYNKDKWETFKYRGREYPIVSDVEEWIEMFFGKDWKTPNKDWKWGLSPCCHIFGEYKEWEN